MSVSYISNLLARARGRMLQQFKQDIAPNLDRLLSMFVLELQVVEDEINDILLLRGLDQAAGAQLDTLGSIVGISREGRTDNVYRGAIRLQIVINNGGGQPPVIAQVIQSVIGAPITNMREIFPAGLEIFVNSEASSSTARLIRDTLAATVGFRLIFTDGETPFAFEGDTLGDGFGTIHDAGIGGVWVGTWLFGEFGGRSSPIPDPQISFLDPNSADTGDPAFILTVTGSGFVSDSVVRWNGSDRTTTFISSTELKAEIPASDLEFGGEKDITVFIPTTNSESNSVTFTVGSVQQDVFTASGTFNVPATVNEVEVLVVAGGGGGGSSGGSGGGGAGGVIYKKSHSVTPSTAISVTVGSGGSGSGGTASNHDGDNSVFDSLTAIGGGGGAQPDNWHDGRDGGSGGGGGGDFNSSGHVGGNGVEGQGFDGGDGPDVDGSNSCGGGGGGASEVGADGVMFSHGGDGGDGVDYSDRFGTSVGDNGAFAGGGGGGGGSFDGGTGGFGGGGTGRGDGTPLVAPVANTGSGGGGFTGGNGDGDGADGVVIVRYHT